MGATAAGDLVGKILSGIKAGDIARNEILLIPAAVGIEGVRDGLRKPATADRLPSLFTILSNGIPIGRRAMSGSQLAAAAIFGRHENRSGQPPHQSQSVPALHLVEVVSAEHGRSLEESGKSLIANR